MNRGNYPLEGLKKKILASGHTQKDIDEALVQLNLESKKSVPTVSATINKINKTNLVETKPVGNVGSKPSPQKPAGAKKSKKLFWIILGIVLLVLIGAGIAGYIYWDKIVGLFGTA